MAQSYTISIKAPARICLFGDHQDYLGLPIIACAIDRFIEIQAHKIKTFELQLNFIDINEKSVFSLDSIAELSVKGNFLAAVLKVATNYGFTPTQGYQLRVSGNIPINAGLSSSSALVVAFTRFVLQTFEGNMEVTDTLVAQIAYQAEVVEQVGPGGKMDQYSCALGGIIYLETDESSAVTHLTTDLTGLVVGESGIPKDTVGLLGDLRGKALRAVDKVLFANTSFNLASSSIKDYEKHKALLSEAEQPYFYAALENYRITKEAKLALQKSSLDYDKIGQLMNAHHQVLRDQLKITVPKIDQMIDAALEAGAYGAKIVGSGGGGSICVICLPSTKDAVIQAIKSAGAKDAYSVQVFSNKQTETSQ